MKSYNKHLIILGTARSGTSWLSEIIARQNRYRLLYEPEHEFQTKEGNLLVDKWITADNSSKEVDAYLKRIFSNSVDNNWIAQHSNRKFKRHLWPFLPKKYIIKFVRCNLMGKYLNEVYNMPIVHLLRNPYDVLYSQRRSKFPWLLNLDHFVAQRHLQELLLSEFKLNINDYKQLSELQILCLRWCIENVIPVEIFKPSKSNFQVIKYEDLVNDVQHFYELCNQFNIEAVGNIEKIYSLPSSKTHSKSIIKTQKPNNKKWGDDDLKEINTILKTFRTELYPIVSNH